MADGGSDGGERLAQVVAQVADVFDSDRQPHQAVADAERGAPR